MRSTLLSVGRLSKSIAIAGFVAAGLAAPSAKAALMTPVITGLANAWGGETQQLVSPGTAVAAYSGRAGINIAEVSAGLDRGGYISGNVRAQQTALVSSEASLTYEIMVTGSDSEAPIPVTAISNWGINGAGQDISVSGITLLTLPNQKQVLHFANSDQGGFGGGTDVVDLLLMPNVPYQISLQMSLGTGYDGENAALPFFGTGSLVLDPLFTIDPAFAGRYVIEASPGISFATSIDEPSTALIILSALALVLGFSRVRQGFAW